MQDAFAPYEPQFANWVDDGYSGCRPETVEFLDHVLDSTRERQLWPGQQGGLLRTIFAYEVLGKKNLLLNIVTGGGKTAIIGASIAWLRWAHDIRSFLILCPNTIVRDRLAADFEGAQVFRDFDLFPGLQSHLINDLNAHVLKPGATPQGMLESGVVLGNIHQLYGKENNERLAFVMNHVGDLAVFNDEAHNTPAPEYNDVLKLLAPKTAFRLDTTATPDRADGQEPDTEMIYEYGIPDALSDGIIKSTVVYQPSIKSVELTYTDPDTGEKKTVDEIDWAEIDARRVKATKWVTDPEPRREQLKIAIARLEEQKLRAKGRYKPILFVVSVGITDAREVKAELEKTFGLKTLVVTEESDEEDRRQAMLIGEEASPYEAIVSVLMLREGWDVPEVSVITLLRKFSSHVYGQQVIGRGLRKVLRKPDEPEILCVVDHPKLDHGWLWDLVGAKVKQGVEPDQQFDLDEDLPEPPETGDPDVIHPELLITIPAVEEDEGEVDFADLLAAVGEEDEPRKDWRDYLGNITYEADLIEITAVELDGIKSIQLNPDGFVKLSPPDEISGAAGDTVEPELPPRHVLVKQLNSGALALARELLVEKGFAATHADAVYVAIVEHVNEKLLEGKGAGAASEYRLLYSIEKLSAVRETFMSPGIVSGMITFPLAGAQV